MALRSLVGQGGGLAVASSVVSCLTSGAPVGTSSAALSRDVYGILGWAAGGGA